MDTENEFIHDLPKISGELKKGVGKVTSQRSSTNQSS
jgi:uncharacterized protein YjbJ (UPF0337 family)